MMTITRGDLEVLFYTHHNGEREEERVQISIGGARSDTWLSLQEFCELMAECRKEISARHWGAEVGIGKLEQLSGSV
jgi:hypothetical protein